MATYLKKSYIRYLSDVKSGILSLGSDKFSVDDSGTEMIIGIWDKFVLTYADKSTTDKANFTLTFNNETTVSGITKLYYGNVSLEIIEGDNFVSFKLGPDTAGTKIENTIYIVELKADSTIYYKYLSYGAGNGFDYYNIENIGFSDMGGGILDATKSSIFPYEAQLGYLDYNTCSNFVVNSNKAFQFDEIYDCTQVTPGDKFLLNNNVSFLAIGQHSIIPISYSE